ncbi:MAG: flagellar basal body L-ring protein FlgH [Vicinamibacterales bacterium]
MSLAPRPASAQTPDTVKDAVKVPVDNYDIEFQKYLAAARAMNTGAPANEWAAGLFIDRRAHRTNDIVTVRVVETISATGTADSSLNKKSEADASVSKLFGLDGKLPSFIDPTSLAASAAETKFKGGGTTTRSGDLTTTMPARVVEVLPNGDLVLEGIREIDINGDRQIIVLTGTVRPTDVTRANAVLSSQIAQLRIRYYGRGLIKDNLKPGWLIRALNKIF